MINLGAIAVQMIREWAPFSPENRAKRKARRAARRARRGKQPDEESGEFFTDVKETEMLSGYKTYLGIATAILGTVLGWLGVGDAADASTLAGQIVGAIDQILTVGGLAFAAYGRAKAKP